MKLKIAFKILKLLLLASFISAGLQATAQTQKQIMIDLDSEFNAIKQDFLDSKTPTAFGGHTTTIHKPISRLFQKECPGEYAHFKNSIESHLKDSGNEQIKLKAVRAVQQCNGKLIRDYVSNYEHTAKQMKSWGTSIEELSGQFSQAQFLPPEMEQAKDTIAKIAHFKKTCYGYHHTKNVTSYGYGPEGVIVFSPHGYAYSNPVTVFVKYLQTPKMKSDNVQQNSSPFLKANLEHLDKYKCHEQKAKLMRSSSVMGKLVNTPQQCQQRSGCVSRLRKFTGLNLSSNESSLFQVCEKNYKEVQNCCSSNHEECKTFKQNQTLSQLINGPKKAICKVEEDQKVKDQVQTAMREACDQSSKQYITNCVNNPQNKTGFYWLRNQFLECFSIPDLAEASYTLHKNNACHKQITEIKTAFNKELKQASWNTDKIQSLEDFFKSGNSKEGYPGIRAISKNLNETTQNFKDNHKDILQATTAQLYKSNCSETEKAQNKPKNLQETWHSILENSLRATQQKMTSNQASGNTGAGTQTPSHSNGVPNAVNSQTVNPRTGSGTSANTKDSSEGPDFDNLASDFFPDSMKKAGGKDSSAGALAGNSQGGGSFSLNGESQSSNPADSNSKSTDTLSLSENPNPESKNSLDSEEEKKHQNNSRRASRGTASSSSSFHSSRVNSGLDSSGFYGSNSNRRRSTSSKNRGRIRETIQRSWITFRGDPRRTVSRTFQVHGSDVDLLNRQKILAQKFCKENECNF